MEELFSTDDVAVDEDILNAILSRISTLWDIVKGLLNQILHQTGTYSNLDALAQILAKHPFFSFCAIFYIIIVFLPFLFIVALGLTTILLTFTGVILFEGTVISIVSLLLFGSIGALVLILAFFGFLIATGIFGFIYIYDLWDNSSEMKALTNFISKEKCSSDMKIAVIEATIDENQEM